MRDSNRSGAPRRGRWIAPWLASALILTACGASAAPTPSPVPTPVATPSPTPDPHLIAPATIESVYSWLQTAGLKVVANTGAAGGSGEPRRSISVTYADWPLVISEYSSTKALANVTKWKAGVKPKRGQAPVAIKGLNILVEWGPTTGAKPPKPDAIQQAAAEALVAALDPLLYPLKARTMVALPVPDHTPVASPSPSTGASPSAAPTT